MLRLAAWSARHPWIVVGAALLLALAGAAARRSLVRDVIPDLSDPQIGVVADWMGHPAAEVAGSITGALTRDLEGIPGSTAVRGTSMPGMAYVDVVFDASADLAAGRRAIAERVDRARPGLPANARLQVGPAASSTGWVFQYVLVDPHHHESTLTLGRIQDDILRPALASLPGVAEVASVGGGVQQMVIEVRQDQLRARSVALSDVVSTLRSALVPGGAGRASAGVEDVLALPVAGPPAGGAQPTVRDLASVRIDDDTPTGLADFDGVLRAVGGIVVAERGADPAAVAGRVKRALEPLRVRLPPGVQLVTVYDREALVDRVGATLLRALAEEVGVVVLVIVLFLLHGRSALVPLVTLPVVLLLTFGAMWILGLPATLMSLGGMGIALGLAVDADVVALEACHRRVEAAGDAAPDRDRRLTLVAAAAAFAPAILTSLLITALAFLPVFAFTGETGRLLRPLAATKTLVIGAAALVSLTLAPALRDWLLAGRLRAELDNPLTRWLVRVYRPFVHFALARPLVTLLTAALAVASCLPILSRLGGEFLPRIDEGDLLFMPTTMPGVPADAAALQLDWQARTIAGFGEVATVFGKVGRAGTATDPAPYSMAELTIRLRPRSEWPAVARPRWYSGWAPGLLRRALRLAWPEETPSTTPELVERLDKATRLPGWTSAWTAPVRARMDMMSTNMRTPVGLRLVAATPERLDALGPDIRTIVSRVPGTRSAVFESFGGEARLELAIDPAAVARHGVDPALARSTADLLLTGGQLGDVERPGERDVAALARDAGGAAGPTLLRVRVQPTLGEAMRGLVDQVREATVRAAGPSGDPVPLALLGHATYETRPAALRTEHGEPVAYVYVDLGDGTDATDITRFIARAQRELDDAIAGGRLHLDPGERLEWAGQYELLAAGERRLTWIVPTVALSMLALLFLLFRSLTEALIVLVSVPFALVGSFWALFLAGYPLSAPVWVGLLSVLGLAMQTGVVMVVYIDEAFHRRLREGRIATRDDIVAAHAEGTVQRLRPKLMTIATMAAGLLPLVWADGAGAEIMRRVAVPMIGGLATSAFLTLEVLPVLYTIWRHRQLLRARRAGVAVEAIIGPAPGWARPAWPPNAHP